jgi:heat shock protein HtpX
MPRVYVIPNRHQCVATGRDPHHAAVAATEGLLRILSETELEGVIAHELAHVKHRDILISSVAATIARAILMLVRMAQFGAMFGAGAATIAARTLSRCWRRLSWRPSPPC